MSLKMLWRLFKLARLLILVGTSKNREIANSEKVALYHKDIRYVHIISKDVVGEVNIVLIIILNKLNSLVIKETREKEMKCIWAIAAGLGVYITRECWRYSLCIQSLPLQISKDFRESRYCFCS
jgi:hypothetical protein